MNEPQPGIVCVACSVLRCELESLRVSGEVNFPIHYLESMLHMQPVQLGRAIDSQLDVPSARGSTVLLVYGDCHSHMREQESKPGVCRVKGRNCIEILLGGDRYRALRRTGAFFLLPEWAQRWREIFERELGLSGTVAKDFMREMHTKLLYLDTGQIPVPTKCLEEASESLGLPWEVVPVGLDHLLTGIREALNREGGSMTSDVRPAQGVTRGADAFLILDILGRLLHNASNPGKAAEGISSEIRELTGAKTVFVVQCGNEHNDDAYKFISIAPSRRRDWAASDNVKRIVQLAVELAEATRWQPQAGGVEAERILSDLGVGDSIVSPLAIGSERVGCLILFDIPEAQRDWPLVLNTLEMLSTSVALVLRNALLCDQQEAAVERAERRSQELRTIVKSMVGRENRMAELKQAIKALREQIEQAGLTPVAGDPLFEDTER